MMKILKKGTSILIISCLCLVASKSCFAMENEIPLGLDFKWRSPGDSFLSYAFSDSNLNPNDYKIKNADYEKKLQKTTHIGKNIDSFFSRFKQSDYESKVGNILSRLDKTNIIDCLCYVQDYLTYDYCVTVQRGVELDKKSDPTSDESKELIECMKRAKSIQNLLCNTSPSEIIKILKVWEFDKAKGTNRWSKFVTSNWDKLHPNYNILCPEMDEVFVRAIKLHNSEIDDDTQDVLLAQFQRTLHETIDTSGYANFFAELPYIVSNFLANKKNSEAEQWLKIGASLGYRSAMEYLCTLYGSETFGKDKIPQMIYWYKKARALKYCESSSYFLATLYEKKSELQDFKKAFKYYKMAAEESPDNCCVLSRLGNYYLKELGGIPKDEKLAFKYFQRAAKLGDIGAKYNLGYCYTHGIGIARNYSRAAEVLENIPAKSVSPEILNNISAMLGVCYSQGFKDPEHVQLAIHHLELAANHGNEISAFQLGYLYYTGEKVSKDFEKAFKYFKQAAEKNHRLAICYLARCYMDGSGCEKNEKEALKLYHKDADELMCSTAMIDLAIYYSKKPEHHKKAIEYLTRASNLNDDVATINLGHWYRDGSCSMPVNLDKAIELLKKIADKGIATAIKDLGDCYFMKKFDDQAFQMYNQASDLGELSAHYGLAQCYANAYGCSRDLSRALELYKESKSMCPKAAYDLGCCYYFGYGCDKNLDLAEAYYRESISICEEDKKDATAALVQVLLTKNSDDKEEIFKLCYETAENGYFMSIYTLAYLYMHGIGVEKNETLAKEWYQKAKKKDNIDEILKIYVDKGRGIACDPSKKIQWLEEIAEYCESTYAMFTLGLLHEDEERALAYFEKAAEKDYEDAMYVLITKGKNQKKWYNKLIEKAKESHKAKYYVACCLGIGLGTDRNINKAIQCCREAILACPDATPKQKEDARKSTCKGERQFENLKSLYQDIEITFIPETRSRVKRSPISKLDFVKDNMVRVNAVEQKDKNVPQSQASPYTVRYWNTAVQADAKKNLDTTCEWGRNLDMLSHEQKAVYTTKLLAKLKGTPLVSIQGKDLFDLIGEKKLNYTLHEARLNNAQGEKDGSVIIYGVDEENKEIVIFYIGPRFGAQHKNEISINLEAEEKGVLATADDDKKTC